MKRVAQGFLAGILSLLTIGAAEARAQSKDRYGDSLPDGAIARLGTLRFRRAGGWLTHVAYSTDGKTLACASGYEGASVSIFAADTGVELRRFAAHGDRVTSLAFSPDGKFLATSSGTKVELWDPTTGDKVRDFDGAAWAFSADKKTLVIIAGGEFVFHDIATGKVLRGVAIGGNAGFAGGKGVWALACAPDQTCLATARAKDDAVRIWDAVTGKQLHALAGHGADSYDLHTHIAFAPDSKSLVSTDWDAIRFWDLASGKQLKKWDKSFGRAAFAPDGKKLAFSGSGRLHLWDTDGASPASLLDGIAYEINHLAFAADGKRLAASTYKAIRQWDIPARRELRSFHGHSDPVESLTFSHDGKTLVSAAVDSTILWDLDRYQERRRLVSGSSMYPVQVGVAPDGKTQVMPDESGTPWLIDLETGKRKCRLEGGMGTHNILWSGDGKYLSVPDKDHVIRVHDAATGKRLWQVSAVTKAPAAQVLPDAFTPDGKFLVVWCNSPAHYSIHAAATGELVKPFAGETVKWGLVASPDGHTLAMTTMTDTIRLWDLAKERELPGLKGPYASSQALSFSPDGRYLGVWASLRGSKSADSYFFLWDVARGRLCPQFGETQGRMHRVAFAPDGRSVVIVDWEGHLRLWETATGLERATFDHDDSSHRHGHRLAFSTDGRLLASATESAVLVWDLTGRAPDGRWRAARLSEKQLLSAWNDLAGADARQAFRSMWLLTADPEQSVSWLRKRLQPVILPEAKELQKLLDQVGSPRFETREQAMRSLARMGEAAAPALAAALAAGPPVEARRRFEQLREQWRGPPVGVELQTLRAIEALEHIHSADARKVLEMMAGGARDARLTREAAAALARLARRAP
jgi:WD40 repeat protein